jgi:hypothetical protein
MAAVGREAVDTPRAFQTIFTRIRRRKLNMTEKESERIGADPVREGVAGTKVILVTQ